MAVRVNLLNFRQCALQLRQALGYWLTLRRGASRESCLRAIEDVSYELKPPEITVSMLLFISVFY